MKTMMAWYGVMLRTLISGLIFGMLALSVQAVPLAPGGVVGAAGEPDPVGGVVLASTNVTFSGFNLNGSLTSRVISGDTSNPFGAGALTFTYLLSNSAAPIGVDSMGRLTVNGWDTLSTDVSFQTPAPAGSVIPLVITRDPNGKVIGFTFVPQVQPGQSSALLVVQTSSTTFAPSFASVINGSVVSPIFTYAAIPEPATFVLVGFGLLGMLAFRRRK
jgi:hypothetical protein